MNENENFWYHNYQVVQGQLVEYYDRIQKAIEYIEKTTNKGMFELRSDNGELDKLLGILKGSDNNE